MVRLSVVMLCMVAACGHSASSSRSPSYGGSSPTEPSYQPSGGGLSPETEAHMACVQHVDDENTRRAQTDEPLLYVQNECGDSSAGSTDGPSGDDSATCADGSIRDAHCGCGMHPMSEYNVDTCLPNGSDSNDTNSSSESSETAQPADDDSDE